MLVLALQRQDLLYITFPDKIFQIYQNVHTSSGGNSEIR